MSEILPTLTQIFSAAALALLLSRQLNQPAIPLYILSGLLLTKFVTLNQVLELSQVGIAFLVFIYGVKFSTTKLKSVADRGVLASAFSIVGTTALSVPVALLLGFQQVEIIVFAAASALSSSPLCLSCIILARNC